MNVWQAFILGCVEGLTEYLPVSSTGHLLLVQRLMGFEESNLSNSFAIFIQGGAIAAVIGLYRIRLFGMFRDLWQRNRRGYNLAGNLILAFLPAATLGFFFNDLIEHYLFGLWAVVAAWFVGGIILILFAKKFQDQLKTTTRISLENITWQHALIIGLAQSLALWPGTSRSLVTILAALLTGLSLSAALEFSFLLGLLTLGAATTYKALQYGSEMTANYGGLTLAVGFFSAWFFAAVSIKWMVTYLERHSMAFFGYWRIALALATIAALQMGLMGH